LVWDLDNTLWSGTILEADHCRLRPGVRLVLDELDRRGILLSIASANDPDMALATLRRKSLAGYFLHPQVGWNSKVRSIQEIADKLGIGLDTIGFIDDEPFEREQVRHLLPGVRTYPAGASRALPELPEFKPPILTSESRGRRHKYLQAVERDAAAESSRMSRQEFLDYCRTTLTLRAAVPDDLTRILELMQRTHKLNSTGVVYDGDEVAEWLRTGTRRVHVAQLADQFVDYGRVGVAVSSGTSDSWELTDFLMSCRVLARGITGYFLAWLVGEAHRAGARRISCLYRPNGRNHRLDTLYKLAGFTPKEQYSDGSVLFEKRTQEAPLPPSWLTVEEVSRL
jgi:FkbH-like protein